MSPLHVNPLVSCGDLTRTEPLNMVAVEPTLKEAPRHLAQNIVCAGISLIDNRIALHTREKLPPQRWSTTKPSPNRIHLPPRNTHVGQRFQKVPHH